MHSHWWQRTRRSPFVGSVTSNGGPRDLSGATSTAEYVVLIAAAVCERDVLDGEHLGRRSCREGGDVAALCCLINRKQDLVSKIRHPPDLLIQPINVPAFRVSPAIIVHLNTISFLCLVEHNKPYFTHRIASSGDIPLVVLGKQQPIRLE